MQQFRRRVAAPAAEAAPTRERTVVDPDAAASKLAAFLSSGTRERSPRRNALDEALDDARGRARTGEWADARGPALVGLYALCHELVYGVEAAELRSAGEWSAAVRCAGRALAEHFGGDADLMADFVKWTWEREKGREAWARRTRANRPRLGWRLQFSPRVVTDWRVDVTRASGG